MKNTENSRKLKRIVKKKGKKTIDTAQNRNMANTHFKAKKPM